MSATLLDCNILIALGDASHVHFRAAERWFAHRDLSAFATCAVTQGSLMRHLLRQGIARTGRDAALVVRGFEQHPRHTFWTGDLAMTQARWDGVVGHSQVTDAYLAALARHHGGRVATLDRGFAALHDDVVDLVPH